MRPFALTVLATGLVVVLLGWFTGFRTVLHGALLSVLTAAFLPFLLLGAVFLAAVLLALILAAVSDGELAYHGEGMDEVGSWIVRLIAPYYRFLARQRHPVFWGVPVGILFGALQCWAIIGLLVLPGEARTIASLASARQALEAAHAREGAEPRSATSPPPEMQKHPRGVFKTIPHQALRPRPHAGCRQLGPPGLRARSLSSV